MSSAADKRVELIFGAVDKMSAPLIKMRQQLDKALSPAKDLNKLLEYQGKATGLTSENFKKFGNNLTGIGKKMSIGITAPVVGAMAYSAREFAKFENDMIGVKTLLDETSFADVGKTLEEGFKDLSKGALDTIKDIPVELEKVSKASFDAVSAGVAASGANNFVKVAGKLAVAGLTDISIATDGMTSAMNAYNMKASDATKIASTFFASQKYGKTTIAELSGGFGLVGSIAADTGVQFNELMAAVSAATTAGIRTNSAFTGMKALLSNIVKPTADAAREAKRLGVEFSASRLRQVGFKKFMDDITNSSGFTKDSLSKLFGSVEALGIASALSGNQAGAFKNILTELNKETGKLNEDINATTYLSEGYRQQSKSLSNQLLLLKNNFQVVAIEIGQVLAPFLNTLMEKTKGVIGWFKEHPTIAKFAAILAVVGAVVGPIILVVGQLAIAISALMPVMAALAGIVAIIGFKFIIIGAVIAGAALLIYKYWEPLTKWLGEKLDWISEKWKMVTGFFKGDNGLKSDINLKKSAQISSSVDVIRSSNQKSESKLFVEFMNMPKGSKVSSESKGSGLDLALGRTMAF